MVLYRPNSGRRTSDKRGWSHMIGRSGEHHERVFLPLGHMCHVHPTDAGSEGKTVSIGEILASLELPEICKSPTCLSPHWRLLSLVNCCRHSRKATTPPKKQKYWRHRDNFPKATKPWKMQQQWCCCLPLPHAF